jgi:hypothetical protein
MGLLNKIFRADRTDPAAPESTRFAESETDADHDEAEEANRSTVRKELVQVTLRETMRRHAVPSDWLEVRMLPVASRRNRTGMHVQLVVKQGEGSLLTYIPAFQSSLMAEIEKFDPRAWEWLLSISWEFASITSRSGGDLPTTGDWPPGRNATAAAATAAASAAATAVADEEVMEDLQALFAIRDAALKPQSPEPQTDFEATRPGFDITKPG